MWLLRYKGPCIYKVQEKYRTPNILDQKINSPLHKIIKTLNTQNKEIMLKAAGGGTSNIQKQTY